MNANKTHAFYTTLATTNLPLLEKWEQLARSTSFAGLQAQMQEVLTEEQRQTLDYPRLHALLRRDLSRCDLPGEDFQDMPLEHVDFTQANLQGAHFQRATLTRATFFGSVLCQANLQGAHLTQANFREANLTEADLEQACLEEARCQRAKTQKARLSRANLQASDWSDADLVGADLVGIQGTGACFLRAALHRADLSSAQLERADFRSVRSWFSDWRRANLRGARLQEASLHYSWLGDANLEGADLRGCWCSRDSFDDTWQVDTSTLIDRNNHVLIGMVLLNQASTPAQRHFALRVQTQTELCWPGFLRLLLRTDRELIAWARQALSTIESLREVITHFERQLERSLEEVRHPFDVRDSHPRLHDLLCAAQEEHPELSLDALYWYLRGVVFSASQQAELQIEESHKQLALEQLRWLRADEQ